MHLMITEQTVSEHSALVNTSEQWAYTWITLDEQLVKTKDKASEHTNCMQKHTIWALNGSTFQCPSSMLHVIEANAWENWSEGKSD